jgi:sugar fermentation stimulation protein A
MRFDSKLISGRLIKRYKRFLADVELDDGSIITAHCTNSGSMKTCIEEGAPVLLSHSDNPNRKTAYTWEMIFINNNWIGINTMMPNKIVFDAVQDNQVEKLSGYTNVQREVKFEDSRFDIFAENVHEKCFIEVKNVTMKDGDYALFPDAVTTRGKKHLDTLIKVKKQGMRAVMVYIVQRMDVSKFSAAKVIDPEYDRALRNAVKNGVEVIAVQVEAKPDSIEISRELPVVL